MTHPVASLRSRTLTDQVRDAIRQYVTQNNLAPGDALPSEAEFARTLEVSRNAVREAVKSLESTGLVEVQRGNGLFVKHFSFAPLLATLPYGLLTHKRPLADLLEIRQILELGLIERVVRDHKAEDLVAIDSALDTMRALAEKGEKFQDADRAFHHALFTTIDNEMVTDLIDVFWLAFDQAANHLELHTSNPLSTYEAHAEIMEAVRSHDVSLAKEKLAQHYDEIAQRLNVPDRVSGEAVGS